MEKGSRGEGQRVTTVLRHDWSRERSFVCVLNRVARDPVLSYGASGLLTHMLSLPDDWRFSAQRLADDRPTGEGRDRVRRYLDELEAAGYVRRITGRDDRGRIVSVVTVSDEPVWREPAGRTEDGFPGPGSPAPVIQAPIEVPRQRTETEFSGDQAHASSSRGLLNRNRGEGTSTIARRSVVNCATREQDPREVAVTLSTRLGGLAEFLDKVLAAEWVWSSTGEGTWHPNVRHHVLSVALGAVAEAHAENAAGWDELCGAVEGRVFGRRSDYETPLALIHVTLSALDRYEPVEPPHLSMTVGGEPFECLPVSPGWAPDGDREAS